MSQISITDYADFIRSNETRFYRLAYSYVKNRDDALDVVQEAVAKGLDNLGSLRQPEYIRTWFYRILVNESINFLRRNKGTVSFDEALDYRNAPDEIGRKTDAMSVYSALDRLPPNMKTVVILRFFEDMQLSEIASVTGSGLSAVKHRLYRALERLKIDLEREGGYETV